MEKTRFAIISALFRLSKIIGRSLKLAESLASGRVEDEAGNKDICKNIRREMKTVPALLNEMREYSPNTTTRNWHTSLSGCTGMRNGCMDFVRHICRIWARKPFMRASSILPSK